MNPTRTHAARLAACEAFLLLGGACAIHQKIDAVKVGTAQSVAIAGIPQLNTTALIGVYVSAVLDFPGVHFSDRAG